MEHPDVGFLVVDAVTPPVDPDRLEGAGHHVAATRREAETRPLLPLADPSAHRVAPRCDPEDPGSETPVNPEPRIERGAVRAPPSRVLPHRRQRIVALRRRPDRSQEGAEPPGRRETGHRPDEAGAPALASLT